MTNERVINFGAGPAMLPTSVLEEIREEILNYRSTGIGILEHSHRGPEIDDLFAATEELVRQVGDIPNDYDVLFLTGGASTQFAMVPLNLLEPGQVADYILSGPWSNLAIKEGRIIGNVNIAGSGEASDFKRVPDTFRISSNLAYVHFTSNETSLGTQFAEPPNVDNTPVVCDACSDLFSRRLDIRRYGMIYASAQKNLGTAGVTLVIIHQDLVERGAKHLPTILQYRTHVSAASRYNTPPVFAMLIMNRMLRWISQHGGLAGMEEMNNRKSAIVYDGLDRSPLFRGMADASCRSMVSATFTTGDRQQDERFAQFAESRGLMNLRGHRSVGGLRASLYNGMAIYGAERLVDAMREFETSVAHETNSPTAP